MNRITHGFHLWRLERMMIKADRLDSKISKLGSKIHRYEKTRFKVPNVEITLKHFPDQ